MSLAIAYSRAQSGISAPEVSVEVHLTRGLPAFSIVGLPETVVKESRDRVRGAIINSNFEFPRLRITVNLAPADLPKEGGRFDLPIALGILAASAQIPKQDLDAYIFLGELALSGELRKVKASMITALSLRNSNKILVLPATSAGEAALVHGVKILTAKHLIEVCAALNQQKPLVPAVATQIKTHQFSYDFSDVKGQPFAKSGLEISAAGGHSVLLTGPPGTGKTMLATRLATILPKMKENEALETAALHSLSNQGFNQDKWMQRPVRSPHHSASSVAIVGGGSIPRPGEISLAHNGILFLDELTEFNRSVLECLREPLELGRITISRARQQVDFPAKFLLVAACNPCPCGYLGDSLGINRYIKQCQCTPIQIQRYRSKLSGPLLDRIDLQIDVPRVPQSVLLSPNQQSENSETICTRVVLARKMQHIRQKKLNSELSNREIEQYCKLDHKTYRQLDKVMQKFGLSMRGYHRIIRVSRTIADLNETECITEQHVMMAVQFRGIE